MKYNITVYSLSYEGKRRDVILDCRAVGRQICSVVISRYARACYCLVITGYEEENDEI